MTRKAGWPSNPQALAKASERRTFSGDLALASTPAIDRDTWLTPRWILDALGVFDLDPCAADVEPARCAPRYCLKADNGLEAPWHGRVFCNPPFSDSRPWLIRTAEHGYGITLVAASIESEAWRSHVWKLAKAVMFLHGRTRFCNPDGSTTTGRPLRPIALIAWSLYDAAFLIDAPFAGVLLQEWVLR